ncbi:restriction endonuclease subunit S [Alcanivorax sp.]|uniref:restriction endonuclease subunit S n=1 Tax=Alcanivorax sp. TaxID=1872427 RepID=UPI003A9545FC
MNNKRNPVYLGDVVTHKKGFAFKSEKFETAGVPVVKVTNFSDSSVSLSELVYVSASHAEENKKFKLKSGDIVIQTVGSWPNNPASVVGKVVMIPGELDQALLNQNAVVLYPTKDLEKKYLFYLLKDRSFKGYIINTAQGAANQASITLDSIFRFQFFERKLDTQRKVAAILTAYDDLIEVNKRRIALLEKMAEELYREWFVRLRFPGYQNTRFVKGVPEGWTTKRLPELSEITYGFPFQSQRFNNDGVGKPIVRIRNIPSSSTSDYTDEPAADKYLVNTGDLLVGMDGEFHINHWYGTQAYLVQRTCRIRPKIPEFGGYLALAIRSPIKHLEGILASSGATVGHLGAKHLNAIEILVPPENMREHLEYLNTLFEQKLALHLASRNLAKTRDLLLPRLISGKLSVEDLDIQFPPSMQEGPVEQESPPEARHG